MTTARPPSLAKPVINSGAKSFLISRKLPPSTSELIKSYILKGLLCISGTISFNGRSLAGGTAQRLQVYSDSSGACSGNIRLRYVWHPPHSLLESHQDQ